MKTSRSNCDVPRPYVVHGFGYKIADATIAVMLLAEDRVHVLYRLGLDGGMHQAPVSLLFLVR